MKANSFGADAFVSIHHDWTGGQQAVIYANSDDARETTSLRLADAINSRIVQVADTFPEGGIYADRRGLAVLKGTTMPAAIVEASRVHDDYTLGIMAAAVVEGIAAFFGVPFSGKAVAPPPKPSAPKPVSEPTIKAGARGSAVKLAQERLNAHGESLRLAVDGVFGRKTSRGADPRAGTPLFSAR